MLQIRRATPQDGAGIFALDQAVEIHPWNRRTIENWYWKFTGDNPAGAAINFVAEDQGEIVACFSVLPIWYWIDGKKIRGSHSIGMIVKPELQNRGLIVFVADKVLKEVEAEKLPFTYGYPNENAYELHKKFLKYEDIAMQPLLERRIEDPSEMPNQTFSTGLEFRKIEKFDESVDLLWDQVKNQFKAIVIRNADFLNWRYMARPDVSYYAYGAYDHNKLVGYCVLKLYQEDKILRGHFLDLFTIPGEKEYGCFLIQNGLEFFKKEKRSAVNLWMQGSSFFQKLLREYGFEEKGGRPFICRFNFERELFKPCLAKEHWYFTMGDTQEIY